MRNLLLFLRKYNFYFIALLLETTALLIFLNYNTYQKNFLHSVSMQISGFVTGIYDNIWEYFSLRQTNEQLAKELAILHSRQPEAFYRTDLKSFFRKDTIQVIQYKYISAKVLNNTTNQRNNYLMIDKGKIHGLKNHMGVIIGDRIVGQIISVSPHFSWVMSVLNKNTRISGKFIKNNQLVNVEWEGGNYRFGEVNEIPKHMEIKKGDTIITSGNSDIYPRSLLIGTIESFRVIQDENFNSGTIRFLTDFNSLEYVEVVIDLMKKEKDELRQTSIPDSK